MRTWLYAHRSRLFLWWAVFGVLGLARTLGTPGFGLAMLFGIVAIAGFMSVVLVGFYSLRRAGISLQGVLAGVIIGLVVAALAVNLLPRGIASSGSWSPMLLLLGASGGAICGALIGQRMRGQTLG